MPAKLYFQTTGINTYINPLLQDGGLVHAVNVESFPYGAKRKRIGYDTYLNNPDSAKVNSLFQFAKNDGTTFFNYRASGSLLYYSAQGTGNWTVAGNGTISNGAHVGHAVLNNTLIVGDGVGSTRHTTNGTSFTNTTLAPISEFFTEYQNRIYAAGTASTLFYSTSNDATNWNTSGTSDSNSFEVPGAGKNSQIFKAFDRLWITKNSRQMYKWDGFSLVDLATSYGPSSPYSVAKAEGFPFYVNQYGHYGYSGGQPQLLSNAVQRQFYSDTGSAVAGTIFPTAPAAVHRYDYLVSLGTLTDDFTQRQIPNAILKYDFQKNEYLNYSFNNNPTAYMSALDTNNDMKLYFGDAAGNTYSLTPQWIAGDNSDNGFPIASEMVLIFTFGAPEYEKKWNWFRGIFNPGCNAKVQVACSNAYTYDRLQWKELGDMLDGVAEYRFPSESRSLFLFVKISEQSVDAPFVYYGCSLDADVQKK